MSLLYSRQTESPIAERSFPWKARSFPCVCWLRCSLPSILHSRRILGMVGGSRTWALRRIKCCIMRQVRQPVNTLLQFTLWRVCTIIFSIFPHRNYRLILSALGMGQLPVRFSAEFPGMAAGQWRSETASRIMIMPSILCLIILKPDPRHYTGWKPISNKRQSAYTAVVMRLYKARCNPQTTSKIRILYLPRLLWRLFIMLRSLIYGRMKMVNTLHV